MLLAAYTLFHVVISLIGIVTGFVVVYGLIASKQVGRWTNLFLITTVATSVTGFFFPVDHFMPSHGVGIVSLIVLAFTIYARSSRHLAGAWRRIYAVGATIALYLNFFVLIVQMFGKIPFLKALAPTQTEPAFVVTQLITLIAFVVLGIGAAKRFRAEPLRAA